MIRPLRADELSEASHLAAAAYREDPGFAYIIPDDALRRRRLPSLISVLLRADLDCGACVSGAFDGQALIGVAATLPPGAPAPRARRWLKHGRGLSWMLTDLAAILRALALLDAGGRARTESGARLSLLAVHPATRGRGAGAALLRDALKAGEPLGLRTFSRESAAWFEARGFRTLTEVRSPVRPTYWTLRRSAKAG